MTRTARTVILAFAAISVVAPASAQDPYGDPPAISLRPFFLASGQNFTAKETFKAVFGRTGNDLTLKVPVTFSEVALGTTLEVPTLDGKVALRVPPGTASGRVLRVRGKGIVRRDGQAGDLLVTLQVTVPSKLDDAAKAALEAYASATSTQDPRPELTAMLEKRS